jgi:hypothetical protein
MHDQVFFHENRKSRVQSNTSGDVVLLRGNMPSLPHLTMPLHELTRVISGVRYSIILNSLAV